MSAILPAKTRRLLLLVLLTLTAGCGLKGDLYLPEAEQAPTKGAEPGPAGDDPAPTADARDEDGADDDGTR